MATAPPRMLALGQRLQREYPTAKFSGIVGDSAHNYGYHRSLSEVGPGDYSAKLSLDTKGVNRSYASALDIGLSAAEMKRVTARLRDAALDPGDTAMEYVREFYGTLDGRTVYGLIHDGRTTGWRGSTSDSSHLWHVHISFFRSFANDPDAMEAVRRVFTGEETELTAKSVWNTDNTLSTAAMEYPADYVKQNPGWMASTGLQIAVRDGRRNAAKLGAIEAKLDLLLSAGGFDPDAVSRAAEEGTRRALDSLELTIGTKE